MKKRIFLVLAMAALLCALAISASAQSIKKFETDELQGGDSITYLEGIDEDMYLSDAGRNNSFYELIDPDFMARAVLENSDGTYTTYPAWYFITFIQYWNGAEYSYTVERINKMSDVTGETYALSDVIRFEFPEYKKDHTFYLKPSGGYGFTNAKYIRVPSHATAISFRGSHKLVEIEYAPGVNITSVSDKAFVDCHSLEIVRIPNTATSLGSEIVCFWSTNIATSALKEIYLGANASSLGPKNPLNTANKEGLKIYVPETLDGSVYTFSSYFPSKSMLIFTGTKEQAEAFGANKVISYAEYASSGFAYEAATIVYDYSSCDAFYDGNHVEKTEDTNPCVLVDCENCRVVNLYVGNDSTHVIDTTMEYESFHKAGAYVVYCKNEGCIHKVSTEAPSLFVSLGYSVSEKGNVGIVIGYVVNKTAIAQYTEVTGKTVKYGVFAALQQNLLENEIFDENGKASSGVISAETSIHKLDVFELKIVGFTDQLKDLKLAMGAYVVTTDEQSTEYSYMQDETKGELFGSYYFVSYNDLV